jgi:prepilin-type processing-associated H-X9-DG protein
MNAQSNCRLGATLADVVVSIAIAALLLGLGTSCIVQTARVQSPRITCQNNLHQIATAMLNYEANWRHFPGYANPVQAHVHAAVSQNGGYVPVLLPYLERNDLFKDWIGGNRPTPYMAMLSCPSDPPPSTLNDELRYVVNSGMANVTGIGAPVIQASGVCFDRTGTLHKPIQIDMEYLNQHDGVSGTLLLTENLDADHWGLDGVSEAKRWNAFVWHRDPVPPTAAFNYPATKTSRTDPSIALARPSSNHAGGVNVMFCDGHYEFIKDGIDYRVWRQMMTSNQALLP